MSRERDKYTASRSGRKGGREKEARGVCGERESAREREREAEQAYTYESKGRNMKAVDIRERR